MCCEGTVTMRVVFGIWACFITVGLIYVIAIGVLHR
jgi:hypothetical protein